MLLYIRIRLIYTEIICDIYIYIYFNMNVVIPISSRFVMLRASSGFYSYAIYEHLKDWPDFEIGETRITFKLRKDR